MMKRSLAEMKPDWFGSSRHQSKNGSEMTVFERQQTKMKLLQQQHQSYSSETQYHDQAQKIQGSTLTQNLTAEDTGLHKTIMMLDHCLGWPAYGHISMPNEMLHSSFDCGNKDRLQTRTRSLTAANSKGVLRNKFTVEKNCDNFVTAATPTSDLEFIDGSLKKRKMDQFTPPDVCQIHLTCKEKSGETSKGNSRSSELAKTDYIQVRARRGQATDRHSLAERVRREKISQKMRFLQDLVPGCNKITGKTGMLDEIINYVQALQSQVEFLSMKLATVTTTLNFNNGNTLLSEVLPENAPKYLRATIPDACITNFPMNQIQPSTTSETILQVSSTAELRTTNTPAWAHDNFTDTVCFAESLMQPIPTWDADFHTLPGSEVHQRKYTTFSSQSTEGDSTCKFGNFTMFG